MIPDPRSIRVGGLTYWEIKCRALNGHRSKLSAEQLMFAGFGEREVEGSLAHVSGLPTTAHTYIEEQLDEIARMRAISPGWLALAREIVNDE